MLLKKLKSRYHCMYVKGYRSVYLAKRSRGVKGRENVMYSPWIINVTNSTLGTRKHVLS